ncbi:hypothetical protein ABH926_003163 [Catenulispora sp. GP43]|uniref:hypothetical protein n=1 Tax=Catenulispora sp. GP43 TaxID=3156263 RepID=UPI0035123269
MFRRTLTTAAAITLAAAGTALIPAGTAQAKACGAGTWCLWSVYQDAGHTDLIGEHGYDCSGKWFTEGVGGSPYVVFQVLPC